MSVNNENKSIAFDKIYFGEKLFIFFCWFCFVLFIRSLIEEDFLSWLLIFYFFSPYFLGIPILIAACVNLGSKFLKIFKNKQLFKNMSFISKVVTIIEAICLVGYLIGVLRMFFLFI